MAAGDPRTDLAQLLDAGTAGDLAEAALALASIAHPLRTRALYRECLAEIGRDLAKAGETADTAAKRGAALAAILAVKWDFQAVDPAEPAAADLMAVLDQKRGVPAALAVIWIDAARRQGWEIEALAFPGHALLRLGDAWGGRAIIDPAAQGCQFDARGLRALLKGMGDAGAELKPAFHASRSDRSLVLELATCCKQGHSRLGQFHRAAEVLEAILVIAPGEAQPWRELGLVRLRLGDLARAVTAFDGFVERSGDSAARQRIQALTRRLRQRLGAQNGPAAKR